MYVRRRAFTLIELLVVIAIIAILIGMLIPAVQKAREAMQLASCKNNLHQLGVAMQTYENANQTLPPGVGPYGCCWGTWQMYILPYLEQGNMKDLYVNLGGNDVTGGGQRYSTSPNTTNITNKRLEILTCPSDTTATPIGSMTSHNYAVNFGNTSFYQTTMNGITFGGAPFSAYPPEWLTPSPAMLSAYGQNTPDHDLGGRFGPPAGMPLGKISNMPDGTSTTMMAAEVIQGQGGDLRGFSWWGGATGFTAFNGPNANAPDVLMGGTCNSAKTYNLPCTTISSVALPRLQIARSRHSQNGVNVVFCDGHVDFVPNTINIVVWRALSTSKGGEATTNY
jgi:prepilin-type N-terminal cleavage/methylation domain-containing protein/prepilin-type processing-associated H-X9-DG protein